MIDGMEASLLGDVMMHGRAVALEAITGPREVRQTMRIDPECFQVDGIGRPTIEHARGCSCDRPWHPSDGPKPPAEWPMPSSLMDELYNGEPVPTVLAALRLVRESRPAVVPMRVTSLGVALMAQALLDLGVNFPSQRAENRGTGCV